MPFLLVSVFPLLMLTYGIPLHITRSPRKISRIFSHFDRAIQSRFYIRPRRIGAQATRQLSGVGKERGTEQEESPAHCS